MTSQCFDLSVVELSKGAAVAQVHHSTTIHSTVGAQYELKTKGMKKRPIRLLISNDCLEVYYKKTSKKVRLRAIWDFSRESSCSDEQLESS